VAILLLMNPNIALILSSIIADMLEAVAFSEQMQDSGYRIQDSGFKATENIGLVIHY